MNTISQNKLRLHRKRRVRAKISGTAEMPRLSVFRSLLSMKAQVIDDSAGKTLVAAATAYAVVNSRPPGRVSGTLQVAYMAPTEILAQQHFQ